MKLSLIIFILTLLVATCLFLLYHSAKVVIFKLFKKKKQDGKKLSTRMNARIQVKPSECNVIRADFKREQIEYSSIHSIVDERSYSNEVPKENIIVSYITFRSGIYSFSSPPILSSKENVLLTLDKIDYFNICYDSENPEYYQFDVQKLIDKLQ